MFAASGCGPKLTAGEAAARYSQELRKAVSENVGEAERRTQMLAIVDRMEAVQLRFSQETLDFVRDYRKLNANYDADRPTFDRLFADFNAKRLQARTEALDLHFQMAALASANEWRPIGRAEFRLYEKTLEANQGGTK